MTPNGALFLERLKDDILVGDGAFGTRLYEQGIGLEASYEQFNLTRPEIVANVFGEYARAGAHVIETNSFCANRHKQKKFGLEAEVAKMAREAARISRMVAGRDRFVGGSIGPLARRKRELDEYTEDEMKALFREPMQALLEGGADLLVLETFTSLSELELALDVAKEFGVPVICEMAFGAEGTTDVGVTAERAARTLAARGADVIGANCRSGLQVLSDVTQRQHQVCSAALSVYPNAGYAEQVDGRYIYHASARYFGERTKDLVEAGANLIGGCCGTTPEHIRAIAEAAASLKPAPRLTIVLSTPAEEAKAPPPRKGGEAFRSLLSSQERFVTVEIDPPKDLDLKRAFDGVRLVAQAGCDAINVPDNALAAVRMDNVIFAELLRQNIDLPVILHLTCRDKNVIALQSDLLGAQMVGIEAILAVTGDPASIGDQPGASSVYDVNSIGLVEMITSLNQGVTLTGVKLEKPTDFAIGVAFSPNVSGPKGLEGAAHKLRKKITAGAHFVETQPIYDLSVLRNFLKMKKDFDLPMCVGLMPIVSRKNADFLHNEVPGVKIPNEVRARFDGLSKEDAQKEGVRHSKELIDEAVANGATHFYIVPSLRRYEMAAELVAHIKSKK